ncbi:hypothetical protein JTE90_005521 [Oedothorax gibbosus]|uniref:SH3 domain-containing protein n=1 Tax=Oedothorax gibbosus TaxID=931172 RepID=A0AAV6UU42_9ARAC|nr:hypothetical protein JTE90_005521 [Oedothorax gibbosus]
MFSQLCRVGIPRTIWDKIAVTRQPEAEVNQSEEDLEKEPTGCQLQNCTFCEYRTTFSKEVQHLQATGPDSCHEVTDNPAYGLSAKNWLEIGTIEEENEEGPDEKMEALPHQAGSKRGTMMRVHPPSKDVPKHDTSHQETNSKNSNPTASQNHTNQSILETRHKRADPSTERSASDQKHSGLSWSVLKQQQIDSVENCDKPCVIEQPICDKKPREHPSSREQAEAFKTKRNSKDRSFPLSLMKPISKMAEKRSFEPPRQPPPPNRLSSDPLSAIEQIKTEESIQEWLAMISESNSQRAPDDHEENRTAWGTRKVEQERQREESPGSHALHKGLQEALELSKVKPLMPQECPVDLLAQATKASPANVPMVVMQCSRLHSHIGSRPPFKQTSLPMGTLVTALYQESDDWMYVQTPHGVEGFIVASNCVPIGGTTTANDDVCQAESRRPQPWEPCDFPIEIKVHKQQSLCVKMKGHFYSERCLGPHTFKSRDSIKTARTVTDILRNSPETKISSQ